MFSNCECECKYDAEMSNMTDLWLSGVFFQVLNRPTPKLLFGRTPSPARRFPARRSISAPSAPRLSGPLQHKFLAWLWLRLCDWTSSQISQQFDANSTVVPMSDSMFYKMFLTVCGSSSGRDRLEVSWAVSMRRSGSNCPNWHRWLLIVHPLDGAFLLPPYLLQTHAQLFTCITDGRGTMGVFRGGRAPNNRPRNFCSF